MFVIIFILFATIFLAYSNGANDNFKGVATLFGSGTTNYKIALWWATITTLLGSITALIFATKLIIVFSGKGLVPDAVVGNPYYLIAVGIGAALTVFIASIIGIPISTTHSLTGALVGAGIVATGFGINFYALGNKFFLPLLLSPFIAAILTVVIYSAFKWARIKMGVERKMCLCVGENAQSVSIQKDGTAVLKSTGLALTIDQMKNCQQVYKGEVLGFDAQWILDKLHFISSGAVGFARGLNDTPKIVALLLAASAFSHNAGILIVSLAMAIGGLLNAKKVALLMSERITKMNHGQGFSANLITAFLVIFASRWGVPVSTTHVSCGSLFGIGFVNKKANLSVIKQIILAWILTLPIAAVLAGACYWILEAVV